MSPTALDEAIDDTVALDVEQPVDCVPGALEDYKSVIQKSF